MRPIEKWAVGFITPDGTTIIETYDPHTNANTLLHKNIDHFCSYCEVFSSDLEGEHIVSQSQDGTLRTKWTNLLLACGRCNGSDNKWNNPVDLSLMYFPHQNNTLLVFEYLEGGVVKVHSDLTKLDQIRKATKLLDLLCLDKYPGNPKYPETKKYKQGFPPADRRWEHRRRAWEKAQMKLKDYEKGFISAEKVVEFARERGFFSVWFTVFAAHKAVKAALVDRFKGTAQNCFDADFNPIPRNPTDLIDTI